MRLALKYALLCKRLPAYRVASEVGISETRLSRIVQGRADPSPEERRRLVRVLRVPEEQLFGDEAV